MIGLMTIAVGWKNYGVMTTSLIYSNVIIQHLHMRKIFIQLIQKEQTQSFMEEAVRDFDNEYEDVDILDIIIENLTISVSTLTIREAAIEKLKTMTDEEIKRRILL